MKESSGIADEALRELSGGIDLATAKNAIADAVEALAEQARALKEADYTKPVKCPACEEVVRLPLSPKDLAQTSTYTSKMVDMVYRLSEFAQGRVDSRPDLGLASLLEVLPDEKVRQIGEWIDEAKAARLQ